MFVNRMPRYEILSEDAVATLDGGWRRIVSELGIEFLLPGGGGRVRAGRPAGRRPAGQARPRLRARAGREGAARVRRAGAEPGALDPHRRRPHVVRLGVRAAVRPRRRRAAQCLDGGLRELLQALADVPAARLGGRDDRRARGHAARLAPPGHGARAADPDRQALHGLGHVGREREGHDRDGRAPLRWPRGDRGPAGLDLADQRQLAAPLRRPDAGRDAGVRARRAAGRDHAVPAHGRDVAGLRSLGVDAADGGGARRDRARAARPARDAGDLRLVPLEHGHAVGLPELRHARVGGRAPLHGPDRPPLRPALAERRRAHVEPDRGRAGRLRGDDDDASHVPRRRELGHALGRVAGVRARLVLREVRDRHRDPAHAEGGVHAARGGRGEPRLGRPPGGRARRPLPRRRPHARALPRVLLPPAPLLDRELRALEEARRARCCRAGRRDLAQDARGVRAAAPRRRRSARRSGSTSSAAAQSSATRDQGGSVGRRGGRGALGRGTDADGARARRRRPRRRALPRARHRAGRCS